MMKRSLYAMLLAGMILAGCAGSATTAPATFDPHLLTITPAPTITPEATYTPFPTTVRLPSSTPFPTFAPVVTLIPFTPAPTRTPKPASASAKPSAIPVQPTSPIGISGVGPDRPELAPILTFEPITFCHTWFLAQVGIVNRGTAAAYNFDVQWSFGWNAPETVHVDELQWFAGPLYLFSGQTAVQCDGDTTLTAWIKIDTGNTVDESIEDNNNAAQTYTVRLGTPAP